MSVLKGAGSAALFLGAAVTGISRGIRSQHTDLSSAVYELATGNPDIDKAVFGTDVSLGAVLAPIPTPIKMAVGNGSKMMRLAAAWDAGLINRTMVGDAYSGARSGLRSSSAPRVDGSIVFGQYNSRFG